MTSPGPVSAAIAGVYTSGSAVGSWLAGQAGVVDAGATVFGIIFGAGVVGAVVHGLITATRSAQESKDRDLARLRSELAEASAEREQLREENLKLQIDAARRDSVDGSQNGTDLAGPHSQP